MTTVHAYITNDQNILDLPHKDLRRSSGRCTEHYSHHYRCCAAVALVLPQLKGKLDGFANADVPTPDVSVVDLTVKLSKSVTAEEVNSNALREAAEGELKGILGYESQELVSMDFKGDSRSSIVDASLTTVMADDMVKVVSWYDNEWGYSCRVVDLVEVHGQQGLIGQTVIRAPLSPKSFGDGGYCTAICDFLKYRWWMR